MYKRNKSIAVLPYLGLAILALAIQPFLPQAENYVTIAYFPVGSAAPVIYKIEEDQLKRLGDCITFSNEEGEIITLCDHYQEK